MKSNMKLIFIGAIEIDNKPCLFLTGNSKTAANWGHWSMSALRQVARRCVGVRFKRNVHIGEAGMIMSKHGFSLEEAEQWLSGFWMAHGNRHQARSVNALRAKWPIKRTTAVAC